MTNGDDNARSDIENVGILLYLYRIRHRNRIKDFDMAKRKSACVSLLIPEPINKQDEQHPFIRYLNANGFSAIDINSRNWEVLKPVYDTYLRFVYERQEKDIIAEEGEGCFGNEGYYTYHEFIEELDYLFRQWAGQRPYTGLVPTKTQSDYLNCQALYNLHSIIKDESSKYKYTGDAIANGIRDAGKCIGNSTLSGCTRIANKVHYLAYKHAICHAKMS